MDRINSANGALVELDEETADLLDFAATLHELSDGRFDITSGVLQRVGWHKALWRRPMLTLAPGMQIDFGGIGKEYAVDRAAALAAAQSEAQCLINFGGDASRFLLKDGVRYSHLLNPLTGWPVVDAPRSVTVAVDTCTQAGMLSTFAMLMGTDAERFLQQQTVRFWCIR